MLSGSIVALITPFHKGEVDLAALKKLVEWHIHSGTHGIVACGSTGEGLLLTPTEWEDVIHTVVQITQKRIPVIAGCSASATHEAIRLIQKAETLGADGALVVTPPYVKPSQEGVYQHFLALHEASQLPLIIYNNPGRAIVDLSIDLISRLSHLPRIVGIKDSNPDITRLTQLRQKIPHPFVFLSGDDPTAAGYLALGGDGVVSVTANVVPHLMAELAQTWKEHNLPRFSELSDKLLPLHLALLAETNPAPLKYAISALNLCHNEVRLPLLTVSSKTEDLIQSILDQPLMKQAA
jgi:4-hydroxy-tetrahydrodipicolinate synthase